MKSFRQYLIEGGKLNARWSNWLNAVNTEHPNPHAEPSYKYRIPKEPGTYELAVRRSQRELDSVGSNRGSHPMGAFSNLDVHGNPIGGFFSISHKARLINTKTDQRKTSPDSLLVNSNRTEEGNLEFKILKFSPFGGEKDIHRYILPAGATTLNAESGDGHETKPGASHIISISDASQVIREHMLSRIKTGTKDMIGTRVAEAHGVSV